MRHEVPQFHTLPDFVSLMAFRIIFDSQVSCSCIEGYSHTLRQDETVQEETETERHGDDITQHTSQSLKHVQPRSLHKRSVRTNGPAAWVHLKRRSLEDRWRKR